MLALLLASLAALAAEPAERLAGALTQIAPEQVPAAQQALAADAELDDATLESLAQGEDWELALEAWVVQAWRADPTVAATVWSQPPSPGLPGQLRVDAPSTGWGAVILADRLLHAGEGPPVRLALAHALTRRIGAHPQIAAGLAQAEADPAVRAALLDGLRRAPAEVALPVLLPALTEADPRIRLAAVEVLGASPNGQQAVADLSHSLGDSDAAVRSHAARSLGRLLARSAWAPLRERLGDSDPNVRLQALRALERIDVKRLLSLPELRILRNDSDPEVARAAQRAGR